MDGGLRGRVDLSVVAVVLTPWGGRVYYSSKALLETTLNTKVLKLGKFASRSFVNILFGLSAWQQSPPRPWQMRLRAYEFPNQSRIDLIS